MSVVGLEHHNDEISSVATIHSAETVKQGNISNISIKYSNLTTKTKPAGMSDNTKNNNADGCHDAEREADIQTAMAAIAAAMAAFRRRAIETARQNVPGVADMTDEEINEHLAIYRQPQQESNTSQEEQSRSIPSKIIEKKNSKADSELTGDDQPANNQGGRSSQAEIVDQMPPALEASLSHASSGTNFSCPPPKNSDASMDFIKKRFPSSCNISSAAASVNSAHSRGQYQGGPSQHAESNAELMQAPEIRSSDGSSAIDFSGYARTVPENPSLNFDLEPDPLPYNNTSGAVSVDSTQSSEQATGVVDATSTTAAAPTDAAAAASTDVGPGSDSTASEERKPPAKKQKES